MRRPSTEGSRVDRATEIDLVGQVLDLNRRRTTATADAALRIPAEHYVAATHYGREAGGLFRDQPVLAGLSVDLAGPGDVLTFESGGIPIVVARGSDGAVRAYVNVCRHRGATVVRGPGHVARSFSCPFHGWVYDLDDGHLVGQPRSCDGFEGLAVSDGCGHPPLPVAERHGILVVRPGDGPPVDVDAWLAGLAPDVSARGYDRLVPYDRATSTWAANWKLLIDTFLESYHVFALHRDSIGDAYLGIASPFAAFGHHNRIVVPQTAILGQAERPRDDWELLPYAVLQYFLAPNVIVSNLDGYVMTWRFVADAVDRTIVEHAIYTWAPVETPDGRAHFDARFGAARSVTGVEDFPESERIHRNLAAGTLTHTNPGRNEPGIVHFHQTLAALMADGRPERAEVP
jgi:phenylpropionate dioxygenase-like ring-hydroxylating dioxygenase large terminal subunit